MATLGGLVKKTAFTPSLFPILKGRVKKRRSVISYNNNNDNDKYNNNDNDNDDDDDDR